MAAMLAGLLLAVAPAVARADGGPLFRVDYANPGITPAHWTLTLNPDGSGHFHSQRGNAPQADPPVLEAPDVDRDVQLSAAFAQHVFMEAQAQAHLARDCESHMKVAFQGWKKITYTGPEGEWSCEFNYSRDKEIQTLGESMQAVAETILEGARFEVLLQHDRLGLDQEMEYFTEAVQDGRAQQVYAIRDILERLAQDDGVLERVRKQARDLLAHAAT